MACTSFFDDYRTDEEIDVYLGQLVATYLGVTRSVAGESIQGRPLHLLRFGSGSQTVAGSPEYERRVVR